MQVSENNQPANEIQNSHIYSIFLNFQALKKRNLSTKDEKEVLIRKIVTLNIKNQRSVEKRDSLQNTIYDLRKLLELVGKENFQECSLLHKKNKTLQQRVRLLQKNIAILHSDSSHLQICGMYGREFQSDVKALQFVKLYLSQKINDNKTDEQKSIY